MTEGGPTKTFKSPGGVAALLVSSEYGIKIPTEQSHPPCLAQDSRRFCAGLGWGYEITFSQQRSKTNTTALCKAPRTQKWRRRFIISAEDISV